MAIPPFQIWHVAGPGTERRRSAFLASPATQIGHRRKKVSQVRQILQTCDENACDPRRKRAGPATKKCWTRDADGLEGEPYSNLDLGAGGA